MQFEDPNGIPSDLSPDDGVGRVGVEGLRECLERQRSQLHSLLVLISSIFNEWFDRNVFHSLETFVSECLSFVRNVCHFVGMCV